MYNYGDIIIYDKYNYLPTIEGSPSYHEPYKKYHMLDKLNLW